MINIVPARPPECNSLTPTTNWMHVARECLDEYLASFSPPNGLRYSYSYYTKPIKYKDTETLQIFFGNWTLHWQLSWHGDEEYDEQERYGDLSESALISLDVETGGRKVPKIGKMQRYVLDRVAPTAAEMLPDAQVKLVEHHLVWEAVEFNPYDNNTVCAAVEKMVEYVKVLAVPAITAVQDWGNSEDIEMQSMHPVLRAS